VPAFLTARSLLFICLTVAFWAFSFASGSQLVSLWLNSILPPETANTIIGFCHGAYYLGMAAGALATPMLMRRAGAFATVVVGLALTIVTLLPFTWTEDIWLWCVLRFVNGFGGALCVVPIETMVSQESPPERTTRYFAFFGVALTTGGAIGFALAPELDRFGYEAAFAVAAGAALVAIITTVAGVRRGVESSEGPDAAIDWRKNRLSFGTAWCQGFLEGGMVAFLQLFLAERGFGKEIAGVLMGALTIGVILFQIPVSFLADRWGKTPTLLACYIVAAAGLVVIPHLLDPIALATVLFAFGACTGAMYPLGYSMLSDGVDPGALPRAYAWYLVIECVGCLIGAPVAGLARDLWGEAALFHVGLVALVAVIILWISIREKLATEKHG
jgi:MFS family permease